jgi:hypothetical protein
MLVFSIAPRQTGQVGLANPLMRFSGLQLEIPLRSREDSPAVDSESLRCCPWRKKPNCWRAMTRTPFDFFLSISGYPLILT